MGYDILMRSRKALSQEEEYDLLTKSKNDEAARKKLVESNINLVGYMIGKLGVSGLAEEEDIFEEGVFGLIRAVDRFNTDIKVRFATYACKSIKSAILRFVAKEKSNAANHSYNVLHCVTAINKEYSNFYMVNERPYKLEDVLKNKKITQRFSPATIREAFETINEKISYLDAPMGEDDESDTLQERFPNGDDLENEVEARDLHKSLLKAIAISLSPQRAEIITYLYGLKDGTKKTLEQTGKKFGITRERVRQIETESLPLIKKAYLEGGEKSQKKKFFVLKNPQRFKVALREAKAKYSYEEAQRRRLYYEKLKAKLKS